MGDSPSLSYLIKGDPNNPSVDSWGGRQVSISHSSRFVFERNTTLADHVPAYAVVGYRFKGRDIDLPLDLVCFSFEIQK